MYKIVLIFSTICILFTTCQKSGNGYIRGTIVEKSTGIPIAGASITLIGNKYSSTKDVIIGSSITDSNGEYNIKYYKKSGSKYFLKTEAENYFPKLELIEQQTKKTALNIELSPFVYLKIRIIKTSSSLNFIRGAGSWLQDLKNIYEYYPHPYDTLLPVPFKIMGFTDNSISWNVHYNPIIANDKDYYNANVYVNKGDTVTYTITFN